MAVSLRAPVEDWGFRKSWGGGLRLPWGPARRTPPVLCVCCQNTLLTTTLAPDTAVRADPPSPGRLSEGALQGGPALPGLHVLFLPLRPQRLRLSPRCLVCLRQPSLRGRAVLSRRAGELRECQLRACCWGDGGEHKTAHVGLPCPARVSALPWPLPLPPPPVHKRAGRSCSSRCSVVWRRAGAVRTRVATYCVLAAVARLWARPRGGNREGHSSLTLLPPRPLGLLGGGVRAETKRPGLAPLGWKASVRRTCADARAGVWVGGRRWARNRVGAGLSLVLQDGLFC